RPAAASAPRRPRDRGSSCDDAPRGSVRRLHAAREGVRLVPTGEVEVAVRVYLPEQHIRRDSQERLDSAILLLERCCLHEVRELPDLGPELSHAGDAPGLEGGPGPELPRI